MSFLPRTAIGIFGFIIFAGWLISLLLRDTTSETNLRDQIDYMTAAQTNLTKAATNVTNPSGGFWGGYDAISGVFSVIYNLIIIIFGFFSMVFLNTVSFVSATLEIPFIISGIFVMMLLLGSFFALISKLVRT